ncbi:MAG: hypothetical protein EF813_01230 [Methanosarcinales archaeon]|nr:MAG: hypothetical protein EF813_01230 [Methanosarcinales archaeon]
MRRYDPATRVYVDVRAAAARFAILAANTPATNPSKTSKKKGKEENPPFISTPTERSVHFGGIVVLTAVDAHTIVALIVRYLDKHTSFGFSYSIAGKERDLVHPAILVPGPLGSDAGSVSSNSACIWCMVDGGLDTLKHLRRLQHC